MSNKNQLGGETLEFPTLRLTTWKRPQEIVKWGASISATDTNKVLVKCYGESEEDAIGKAGYAFYTGFFHLKAVDELRKKLWDSQPTQSK